MQFFAPFRLNPSLLALAVSLGDVVTSVDDKVLVLVVEAAREVAVQDLLGTLGVPDLGVDGGTGHVGNHGVATAPGALDVTERVVLGGGLREPDVTTVASQVARLDGLGDILLDNDGTTSGVDEPRALLHLGDELLVEETTGLLVQGAVDGDNVALSKHVLKVLDTAAANFLLDLRGQRLVVVVEELLAVEGLETAENTLTDTANGDCTDGLALKVELVLGDGSNVPLTIADLLVSRDEVADQCEDGHDNVLSDRDNVAASNFSDGDTTVGLVGGVEVDMVRANTSSDGNFEVLSLGQTLSGQVTGVEGSGDDDFSVNKLLVKGRILTLLVGGGDEGVALGLEPLAQTKLVLSGTEKAGLVLGVLTAIIENHKNLTL